ncbi:MAG: PAS domain S-box protein [Ignavibacteriaceae bacterium]
MSLLNGSGQLKKWYIIFLPVFFSLCLFTGFYLYYNSVKDGIIGERTDDLQTIAIFKINQIEKWLNVRLSEAKYFPVNNSFAFHTKKLLINKNNIESQKYFFNRFQRLRDGHNYKNVLIVSLNGNILFSLEPAEKKVDSMIRKFLPGENADKQIRLTDFYYCPYHNEIHYDILSPVIDDSSSLIAYLIFRVDPNDYLYPLIQEWPVPGKTGETVIFRTYNQRIIFLSKLRYADNSRLSFSIPFSKKNMLAVKGAAGKYGVFDGKDYNNKDVIGNISRVAGTEWYMAVKMDKDEIYNKLGDVKVLLTIILFFLVLLIGSGIVLIYKYRQSNLYKEKYLKEKVLKETLQELKTTLYSIGDGVITTDISGQIVRMNPVAENLTGWKENESKGIPLSKVFNIVDGKSGNKIDIPFQKTQYNGFSKRLNNSTLLISKSSMQIPVSFSCSPITNGKNKINGSILVFVDESKERTSKNLLRESEARFSSIFHNSPIGISITGLDGVMIDVNDLFLETTGYSRQEIIGKTPLEIGLYKNSTDREKFVGAILRDGYVPKMEIDFRMKSGEIKNCYISGELFKIDSHSFLLSTILDISDQKQAELELRKSQEKLALTLEMAKMGYWEYDIESDLFTFNDQFYKMLNTSAEKESGYKMPSAEYSKRFVHPEDIEIVGREIQKVKNAVDPDFWSELEHRVIFKNGEQGNLFVRVHIVKDDKGKTVKSYGFNQNITYRKKAEEELRLSENKFSTVFQISPDIVSINRSADGLYLDVNENFCKITGYQKEEIIGKTTTDFDIWDDKKANIKFTEMLQQNNSVDNFETNFRTKQGQILTTLISARKIVLNDEKCILSIIRDITDRKKSEEALRLSENKFSTAFHISPDAVNINRLSDGRYIDINQGFSKIMGYAREDVIGKTSLEKNIWVKFKDRDKLIKELLLNGEVTNLEAQFRSKEGKIYTGLMSAKKLIINNEECILSITRDITERKKAEEQINKLSRGIEQSPAAIVITDTEGIIEYVNPKFIEITGYPFDEVIGKKPNILKSGYIPPEDYKELWETITGKKEWHGNFLNKKKNGELFWESASISPIINNNGEITNFIAVKEDITEKKKITDELIIAKEKAEEMNRIKSYFYANISHELRTPFVGIMGFAELLRDQLKDPEHKEMAEVILNSSSRLTDTLNKILDITKLEFGKAEINLQKVDATEVINRVQVLYSKTASQNKTEIRAYHSAGHIYIETDETLLHEILNNLINNAVKYTKKGLIEIITSTFVKGTQKFLRINVKDNGIGIPKERQDLIWLEFRQASEGFNRSFEGTGLGLSITKRYTELLNGRIYVESQPGEGSVFTIELPFTINIVEEEISERKSLTRKTSGQVPVYGKLRVLYVEDDDISRVFVSKILSPYYELEEVSNASEALIKVKNNQYSILLVDINLGSGIDGIELTRQIRKYEEYKSVPIIAVTAYASEDDEREFLEKGFSQYISKPFSPRELLDLLKNILKE